MEGENDDLSTHLRWFRNRNRMSYHQGATKSNQHGEQERTLKSSSSSSSSAESSWLRTTLSELDEKTQTMLKLIKEDDADSFAKRAEMYYKRRPELIHMVHDFHRAHRSLAERYQLVMSKKNPSGSTTTTTTTSSEDEDVKSYSDSSSSSSNNSFCCSFSESCSDPDEDQRQLKEEAEVASVAACVTGDREELVVVRGEEMESLVKENKKLKDQLVEKDEEKREVIRQLCFSLDLMRIENEDLMTMNHNNNKLSLLDISKISYFGGGCFFNV